MGGYRCEGGGLEDSTEDGSSTSTRDEEEEEEDSSDGAEEYAITKNLQTKTLTTLSPRSAGKLFCPW